LSNTLSLMTYVISAFNAALAEEAENVIIIDLMRGAVEQRQQQPREAVRRKQPAHILPIRN